MQIKAREPAEVPETLYEEPEVTEFFAEEPVEEPAKPKKRFETAKLIVWICLLNGFLWVWCSYILAWFGRVQIAENLSQVAVTEIIGVVLAYCVKSAIENLSKNNAWPDKPGKDDSNGVG